MTAARLPLPANAAAIRSGTLEHLGEVLVAAPRKGDEVELAAARVGERPRERVRGLERRDDPLEPRDLPERVDRLVVGDRHVAGAALVAHERVLRARPRVVEAGGDGVGLEDLALLVLKHRRERAVQDAARAGGP